MIRWNVFGILAGFVIGQGSMFLAQTYYMMVGSEELLATIGIGLGFSSLIWWVGDFGGSYIVQRLILNECRNILWNFILLRCAFAIFVACILYSLLTYIGFEGEVYKDITRYSSFLIILGSLNVTGYLDSHKVNHIFGPLASLGWLFSAILYFLISFGCVDLNAAYFSASFYVGFGMYVFLQWVYIIVKDEVKITSVKYDERVWRYFYEAAVYTASFFASQVYGRFVPVILSSLFGMSLAGLYIYAKSFVNISSQLISFVRRLEFEKILLDDFSSAIKPVRLVTQQSKSFFGMVVTMLLSIMFVVLMVSLEFINYTLLEVLFVLLCILMLVPWFFASAVAQVFIAFGYQWPYLGAIYASSLVSVVLIYSLNGSIGLYSVIVAELLMFILQLIVLYFFRNSRNEC